MKRVIKKQQYILISPLRGKGIIGDIINVARGYGRYLERFNFAVRLTEESKKTLEEDKKKWLENSKEKELQASKLIEKVKNIGSLNLKRKVAQGIKLYQSIRREDIVNELNKLGIIIKLENVFINNIIKTLGKFKIFINIYGKFESDLEIVVSQEDK